MSELSDYFASHTDAGSSAPLESYPALTMQHWREGKSVYFRIYNPSGEAPAPATDHIPVSGYFEAE